MVNNIIIIVGLLLAFVTGFFCSLKSVNIGLNWKIQIENNQIPTLNNPITEIMKAKEEVKVTNEAIKHQKYTSEQVSEWLNGAGGE